MEGNFPGELVQPFGQGKAWQDYIDPANPAAGANMVHKLGGRFFTRVLSVIATFVSDGNAANRFVSVDYINTNAQTVIRNAAAAIQTASTTQVYQWLFDRDVGEWNTNTPIFAPLCDIILHPAWTIQLTVDNKQATDQLSEIHLVVERFETGPGAYELGGLEHGRLIGRR